MANQNLFNTYAGKLIVPTDTVNEAGGPAYQMSAEHALAQYVITGCLNNTYYVTAQMQLATVTELCKTVSDEFIAKCAIYARHKGYMKDMPSLLVAILAVKGSTCFSYTFDQVIDNGRMLRTFVQMIRSGVLGRKSFGSTIKKAIRKWLNEASPHKLINAQVGQKPSLVDIIRMVHPKAKDDNRNELFKWILGKEHNVELLPKELISFEKWKTFPDQELPDVPFQMLTAKPLTPTGWLQIAKQVSWQTLRMNLNTFQRHDVFKQDGATQLIAAKLSDETLVTKSRVYPYQLLNAYLHTTDVPHAIKEALQDALEIATKSVPTIHGNLVIGVDISGSMNSAVTGNRGSATTKMRYVDVAALFGSAMLRQNPTGLLLPFHGDVVNIPINSRDTVLTNAKKLSDACTNGTNCASVLRYIVGKNLPVDMVVIISDNESWMGGPSSHMSGCNMATETMRLWRKIKESNTSAKLVCIDIAPNNTTQALDATDIYNIGGFSDTVFDLIASIDKNEGTKDYFVNVISGQHMPQY